MLAELGWEMSAVPRRHLARAVLALLVVCLSACGSESTHDHGRSGEAARCTLCGMSIAADSTWKAGATRVSGVEAPFDTPKCLLRFIQSEQGAGAQDLWVTEYYSSERRSASELFYVLASDVEGPMGADLVPVEGRERADSFSADHHGQRVLSFDEIDDAVLDALFR